mgnify:CR=1 FL=1
MTDLLVSPKVELKFLQVNFKDLVYPRVSHSVCETKQRDVNYVIIHGIYKNRHRLFQQHRAGDSVNIKPVRDLAMRRQLSTCLHYATK